MINNLSLFTDFYELTMMQGYFLNNPDQEVVFDYFVRKNPFEGGYMIFAGLDPLLIELVNLQFDDKSIDYLRQNGNFCEEFLTYLSNLKFTCDIFSIKEGELFFPNEPVVIVKGPILEAQLIESMLLNFLNFQSLIATKTARIVESAKGRGILEFGLRRAQGADGALSGTRASIIGGCSATSNTLAGQKFNIPVSGTMAHSWIMSFNSELEAFEKYADIYPDNCTLLVDTYDTIISGVPNAIKIFKTLKQKGYSKFGIRLDSGDMKELSKSARKLLDENDLSNVKIFISNELDESIIEDLLKSNSPIDAFGVGTRLITAHPDSSLTGVYKLAAIIDNEIENPVMKFSNTIEKQTNPGFKNVIRFYDKNDNMIGDLICLNAENIQEVTSQFSSDNCKFEELLQPVMIEGNIISRDNDLNVISQYKKKQMERLPVNFKQLKNSEKYSIRLSNTLKNIKEQLLKRL